MLLKTLSSFFINRIGTESNFFILDSEFWILNSTSLGRHRV